MPGRFFNFRVAIYSVIENITGRPSKIVYENDKAYDTANGSHYWMVRIIPTRSTREGGMTKHEGIVEVYTYSTKSNGMAQVANDSDKIHDAFNDGASVTSGGTKVYFYGTKPGSMITDKSLAYSWTETNYVCYSI